MIAGAFIVGGFLFITKQYATFGEGIFGCMLIVGALLAHGV